MMDNVEISKKKPKHFTKKRLVAIIVTVIVAVIISMIIFQCISKKSGTYTVVSGYVEKISDTQGVVIKQEKVIDTNNIYSFNRAR